MNRWRHCGLQLRQQPTHSIHCADDVRSRLPRDDKQHSGFSICETGVLCVLHGVSDIGDFMKEYGGSAPGGHDQILVFACLEELVVGIDSPVTLNAVDLALSGVCVR